MIPELTARGGVNVNTDGLNSIVSKETTIPDSSPKAPRRPADPFVGLSFYSYARGTSVVISAGLLMVPFPAAPYPAWTYLNTEISTAVITGLEPGSSGYIVLAVGQQLGQDNGIPGTGAASAPPIDFGDPTGLYGMSWVYGGKFTEIVSTVPQPIGPSIFGYLYVPEAPAPSVDFFQTVICAVSVSTAGVPAVSPIHIGSLLLTAGYIGNTLDITVQQQD